MQPFNRSACTVAATLLVAVGLASLRGAAAQEPLRRRPTLGIAAAATPDGKGVAIREVIPDTGAQKLGLTAGDVILSLDGKELTGVPHLLSLLAAKSVGDTTSLELLRGDKKLTVQVPMLERPRERPKAFEVAYGSVTTPRGRLRTLVTRPRKAGRHPAVLLVQGLGCFSVDNAPGALSSYQRILYSLTEQGYVTMRVDKPGCGDSEGAPCEEADFKAELDGFRQALKALKEDPGVDPENVFIFGHSMGGVMGPLLAAEIPVRGVVVYGTVARPWYEYLGENLRRQLALRSVPEADIDRATRNYNAFFHYLFAERKSPAEIVAAHPELKPVADEQVGNGKYLFGKHYAFFQQLNDLSPGDYWTNVNARVLALWGKSDFVSGGDDHALIAKIVNREHPGTAVYRALDGIDHGFNRAATPAESQGLSPGAGEFDPQVITTLREWLDGARTKKS
ncbi:MAG: pdz domain (also known as dhr or glgf) protein [Armatimonadetes bacterium]|nr:pdz domain (also known as dhr or glgf) protein [Armatimonadota bacterium]